MVKGLLKLITITWKRFSLDSRGEVPYRSRQAGIPPNRAENFSCNRVELGAETRISIHSLLDFQPGLKFSMQSQIIFTPDMWAKISARAENPHVSTSYSSIKQIITNVIVMNSLSGRIKKECNGRILDL